MENPTDVPAENISATSRLDHHEDGNPVSTIDHDGNNNNSNNNIDTIINPPIQEPTIDDSITTTDGSLRPLKKIKLEDHDENHSVVTDNLNIESSSATTDLNIESSVLVTTNIITTPTIATNEKSISEMNDNTITTSKILENGDDDDDLFGGGDEEEEKEETKVEENIQISSSLPEKALEPIESSNDSNDVVTTETTESVHLAMTAPTELVVNNTDITSPQIISSIKQEDISAVSVDNIPLDTATPTPSTPGTTTTSGNNDTELVIPRKSNSTTKVPASFTHSGPTQQYTSGTRYGLPPNVNVPISIVRSKLLEVEMNTPGSKLMDVLKSLPVNLINDALTEYDDAVEIKGANSIRNHGAYLYGVVKRYVSVHDRSMKGEHTGMSSMGDDGLTPIVQARLDQLVATGFCSNQEMNDKVKSKIRMLSEKDAIFALDELSSVDRTSIRNFGSYFMGILNRYMRGDASSKIRSSSTSGPGRNSNNSSSGGQQHHHHYQNQRERDRFPPHHQQHQQQHSSSSFRNSSNPRDRFDNRGNNHHDGPRVQQPYRMDNNNPAYDHRSQMPSSSSSSSSQGPGWQHPTSSQQQGMGGIPMMHHGAGGNTGMPNHSMMGPGMHQTNVNYPNQQQLQQQPFIPPQSQPPPYMQNQQQPYGHQAVFTQNNAPHGMPNNSGINQYQPQNPMAGQQQQQPLHQHQSPYMNNQPSMQPQQSPYAPSQNPPGMNAPSHYGSDPMGQPIDILGLADKAASAIQAMGVNKVNPPIGQTSFPSNPMGGIPQQQHQPGYPPPFTTGNPMMGPPMGIQQQVPQPNFPSHQMFPNPQQQQQPMFPGPPNVGNMNRNDGSLNQPSQIPRRRTTASFNELPLSVQYALQNLIATGLLDGQPDDGILGMIMDLPEPMALVGLQKFASIDRSTMRNKFAYLAGVLRRELEKIQRR